MAVRKKKDADKGELYPWLRLLEMEVQPPVHKERGQLPRGRGRPPSPFPRKAVHVTLTDDELKALDGLAEVLSERMGRVHRGVLIAFLTLYLRSRLQTGAALELPPDITTLSDLARYLDREINI